MPNSNAFTLEEIDQILDQLNTHPGARLQYIGSRYVPVFGRKGEDSIEWDNSGTYEPLTIVLYKGNSYTSRQFVPVGVEITNKKYWANTGNYNAQIEQYRQEVAQIQKTIDGSIIPDINKLKDYIATPEQFGAVGDGTTNDYQAFLDLGQHVSGKANKIVLLSNKPYLIDVPESTDTFYAMNLNNSHGIKIVGCGTKIHMKSNPNNKYFIYITGESSDIEICNFEVYSEFDQPSQAFGDHTRKNPVGSNIYPIVLTNESIDTVNIHDMSFKYTSVCVDAIVTAKGGNSVSQNLTIKNCNSQYHAIFLFTARMNNVFVQNCTLTGATEYGDGDHDFYFRGQIDKVYIGNITSVNDSYFGPNVLFYPENSGEEYGTIARVEDYNTVANAFIANYTGAEVLVSNFMFEMTDESKHASSTNYPVFGIRSKNCMIRALNGIVKNKNLAFGSSGKLYCENVSVENTNNYGALYGTDRDGSYEIRNCVFIVPTLISATASSEFSVSVEYCEITANSENNNYLNAIRTNTATVSMRNNIIDMQSKIYLFSVGSNAPEITLTMNDIVNNANTAQTGSVTTSYGNYLNKALKA